MLNLYPSYIRDRGETRDTRAHFRSLDVVESVIAGKALGKSIVDRFLVRATGRFRTEEMSFPGSSYRKLPVSFSISHRCSSFLTRSTREI